ncbi:MAG: hypothetical protein IT305_01515 [Chloroflexi bacterium]|nr:hypothetical protein [Chloroflexota bacterium]
MAEEVTDTPVDSDQLEASSAPDFSEQFADLNNKIDTFIQSQQEPQVEAEPLDILDGPVPVDDDEGEYEYEYEPQAEWDYEEPASDPRVDQVWEWATQREQERIRDGLQALDTKYQDFTEKVPEIRETLDSMGINDPAQRGNAALVERIYLSLKAEADAAAETPAEEAASRGARIERGASGSAPEDSDPDDQFIKDFGSERQKSAFG